MAPEVGASAGASSQHERRPVKPQGTPENYNTFLLLYSHSIVAGPFWRSRDASSCPLVHAVASRAPRTLSFGTQTVLAETVILEGADGLRVAAGIQSPEHTSNNLTSKRAVSHLTQKVAEPHESAPPPLGLPSKRQTCGLPMRRAAIGQSSPAGNQRARLLRLTRSCTRRGRSRR